MSSVAVTNKTTHSSVYSTAQSTTLAIGAGFSYLSDINTRWEILPIGSGSYNAFALFQALKELNQAHQGQSYLVAIVPRNRGGRRSPEGRNLSANQEHIRRLYLAAAIHGMRVLRFSAIFLPSTYRAVGESITDIAAYSLTAYRYAATQPPAHIRNPQVVTRADRAHRYGETMAAALCILASFAALGHSLEYLEESNSFYRLITYLGFAAFGIDMGYAGLQFLEVLPYRE